jgi:2-polyprenyl-6-methoxyphenol hydroxylase-like FAD-dependent oxidoreductase
LADTYRQGRTFLVGDAAQVPSPFGGHGIVTGMGDAANLAGKLARGDGPTKVIAGAFQAPAGTTTAIHAAPDDRSGIAHGNDS